MTTKPQIDEHDLAVAIATELLTCGKEKGHRLAVKQQRTPYQVADERDLGGRSEVVVVDVIEKVITSHRENAVIADVDDWRWMLRALTVVEWSATVRGMTPRIMTTEPYNYLACPVCGGIRPEENLTGPDDVPPSRVGHDDQCLIADAIRRARARLLDKTIGS